MRLLVSIMALFQAVQTFGQPTELDKWYHTREGNNFDGFSLTSGVITDEGDMYTDEGDAYFGFRVWNATGSLEPLTEESSSWESLSFNIRGVFNFEPFEVLMSFDESEEIWQTTKFFCSEPDENGIRSLTWINFLSDDYEEFMASYQFVRELRVRNTVHFRIKSAYHAKQDISFPLSDSATALDNCVRVPLQAPKQEGWRDSSIDVIWGTVQWAFLKPEEMSQDMFNSLFDYLSSEYGYFYFMQVKSIDFINGMIVLYDLSERQLAKIDSGALSN